MSNRGLLFKAAAVFTAISLMGPVPGFASALEVKRQDTGLYRDIFDQGLFYEGTNVLRLDRLYRLLFRKKTAALDVNVYDEVPDSSFFENRHARSRLSEQDLGAGHRESEGPDLSKPLMVYKGKNEGLHPGFFIRDSRGDSYLFKFDPFDDLELMTSAEVIASRFYHAIGYHVPQYDVVTFDPANLVLDPAATMIDDTGFKKPFTADKLEEFLLFIPRDENGHCRASASKLLTGENKGFVSFNGRRKQDSQDSWPHNRMRVFRGLAVFSAWVGNYDVRESNTLDYIVKDKEGNDVLRHYVIDFSGALGSSATGPKPPMFLHEYMMDFGETAKAFAGFGFWEKPWQKRWREAGEKPHDSPAVGYFDNRYFNPGNAKMQLPYYAFKDVSRADGFWAAKIIKSFSDEDIKVMVAAGKLSRPEDADYLVKTLAERRDIIARYWYERANPLDDFDVSGDVLKFRDLSVEAGFVPPASSVYAIEVIAKSGSKGKRIASLETHESSFKIDPSWTSSGPVDLLIRTRREGAGELSPFVRVELNASQVASVRHQD